MWSQIHDNIHETNQIKLKRQCLLVELKRSHKRFKSFLNIVVITDNWFLFYL